MPTAISVNMLRLRLRIERQPRSKKGAPAHRTTGEASASSIQLKARPGSASKSPGRRWRPMARTMSGTDRTAPTQSRRRMSRYSALGPSSRRDHRGLERHAADRAAAGPLLPDLGMHGAGVDGLGVRPGPLGRSSARAQIAGGIGRGTSRHSRPSRNSRSCPGAHGYASPWPDRRSSRRRGPWPRRPAPSPDGHGA